jgi:hypothetical protein
MIFYPASPHLTHRQEASQEASCPPQPLVVTKRAVIGGGNEGTVNSREEYGLGTMRKIYSRNVYDLGVESKYKASL